MLIINLPSVVALALLLVGGTLGGTVVIKGPLPGAEVNQGVALSVNLDVVGEVAPDWSVCYGVGQSPLCTPLSGGSLNPVSTEGLTVGSCSLTAYLTDEKGTRNSPVASVRIAIAPPATVDEDSLQGLLGDEGEKLHQAGVDSYLRGDLNFSSHFFSASNSLGQPNSDRRANSLEGLAASLFGLGRYDASARAFLGAFASSGSAEGSFRNARTARDWDLSLRLVEDAPVPPSPSNEVVIVSSFFRGKGRYSEQRFQEIVMAQTANLDNPDVSVLVLLADLITDCNPREHLPRSSKLRVIQQKNSGAPVWGELLRVGEEFPGRAVVFAHADIAFFKATANLALVPRLLSSNTLTTVPRPIGIALTRRPFDGCLWASGGGHGDYDLPVDLCTGPHGSAEGIIGFDAFALVAPALPSLLATADNLRTNQLGADLKMAEAFTAGSDYLLLDPCIAVAATHLHCSRERSYSFEDDLVTRGDIEGGRYSRAVRLSGPRFGHALQSVQGLGSGNVGSTERPTILFSFPMSGEDWVRGGLEARGVRTGSLHFDAERFSHFPWEGRCKGPDLISAATTAPPVAAGVIWDMSPQPLDGVRRPVSAECEALLRHREAAAKMVALVRCPFDTIASLWLYKRLSHRRAHLQRRERSAESLAATSADQVAAMHLLDDGDWRQFATEAAGAWAAYYEKLKVMGVQTVRLESLTSGSAHFSDIGLDVSYSDSPIPTPHDFGLVSGFAATTVFADAEFRQRIWLLVGASSCSHGIAPPLGLSCSGLALPQEGLVAGNHLATDPCWPSGAQMSNCVVSFSLYGSSERYTGGAIANARMLHSSGPSPLPGWRMRVYYDDGSVPFAVIEALQLLGVECLHQGSFGGVGGQLRNPRTWRFAVAADPAVARFLIRDVDSRISSREAAAVSEWVDSTLPFHCLRDHPSHTIYQQAGFPMQAGMWGTLCSVYYANDFFFNPP